MNSAPYVPFTGVHHLALIAHDLDATVRFYRDLLGMRLVGTMNEAGMRHYFFELSPGEAIAFFGYEGASPIEPKRPGVPTTRPRGFDHLAIGVASKADLVTMRDRLLGAGVTVEGPVDHGLAWSMYLRDPNGIDLELCWNCVEVSKPILADRDPTPAAREGSEPHPSAWPTTTFTTDPAAVTASPGAGANLREHAS